MKAQPTKTKAETPDPVEFKNYKRVYTKRGVAQFANLLEPNRRHNASGVFSVVLMFPEGSEGHVELAEAIEAHFEAYKETLSKADLAGLSKATLNLASKPAVNKDGSPVLAPDGTTPMIAFNFKADAMRKRGDTLVPNRPKVVDAKMNVVPAAVSVGRGSELIVSGQMNAYGPAKVDGGKVIAGVSLALDGAQLLKRVEGFSGPEFQSYDGDDGFVVTEDGAPGQDDGSAY